MSEQKNLISGLTDEILRVTEIIKEYESMEGGVGMFAASIMNREVERAKKIQAGGDVIEMIATLKTLQENKL